MLFRESITAYRKHNMKHINALCWKSTLLTLKQVVHPVITAFKSLKQTFMGKNLEDLQQ
jgi:hypothetical protein